MPMPIKSPHAFRLVRKGPPYVCGRPQWYPWRHIRIRGAPLCTGDDNSD